jgi:creatinine amidohydrolase
MPIRPHIERRYELLFGAELQDRIAERAIAWVPLGPLERHGEHLPWGLDGLKAHAQCLRLAERFGGVVLPAIHVAGIHDPWHKDRETERKMQAEVGDWYLRYDTLRALAEDIITGLANIGFRLIVLNSGHYPAVQGKLLKQVAAEMQPKCPARIIAFDEEDAGIKLDHAGTVETAAYMALCGEPRLHAVRDEQKNKIGFWNEKTSPTAATKEFGLACMSKIEAYFGKVIADWVGRG